MAMSAAPEATGVTSTPRLAALSSRSASTKSRWRDPPARAGSAASARATAAAPVAMAAALRRLRGWRSTVAPADRATAAVPSLLPSSTTTTRSTPSMPRAAAMVAAIRSASSLAGMITATPGAGTVGLAQGDLAAEQAGPGPALVPAQRLAGGDGLVIPLLPGGRGALVVRGGAVRVEVPDRHEQAAGPERPEQPGALTQAALVGGVQPREGVGGGVLVLRQHPADVGAFADAAPVGGLDAGDPGGGDGRAVGTLEGGLALVVELGDVVDPELEAVVHRHVEGGGRVEDVLQPGGLRRGQRGGEDRAARLGGQRGQQDLRDVPAGVAGGAAGLGGDEHLAVGAVQARPGEGQHGRDGGGGGGAVADGRRQELHRRGRGGKDLAQRDPLGLGGQPLERPRHERRRPCGGLPLVQLTRGTTTASRSLAHGRTP